MIVQTLRREKDGWYRFRHTAMACEFELILKAEGWDYAKSAAQATWNLIDMLEAELSRFCDSSDITRINSAPTNTKIRIGHHTSLNLQTAIEIADLTDGMFDISVGKLVPLADEGEPPLPPLAPTVSHTPGLNQIILDTKSHVVVKKATGYTYDLGGLGKGYALDCALGELLCDWEIEAGHISAGGSTGLCWGTGLERNTAWSFDLETGPKPTSAKYKLVLYNKYAVSGSGTWQKGAHIINPQTGRPVRTDRLAWAIHPNAIYADAFSTAAMLLPLSHLQFISEQVTNLAFIIIDPAEQESPILLGDTSMFHFQENQ